LDLSLVIPCYNEESHLIESVKKIVSVLNRSGYLYELIFVDDRSIDNTSPLIKKICVNKKNYRMLFHKENMGRGKTVMDGILQARGEVVGFIDIDLEVSPIYINDFVERIVGGADMVIGDRVYWTFSASFIRLILSRGYAGLVRWILGIKFRDTEAGYKFFNRKKIIPVINTCTHFGWFWDTEVVYRSLKKELEVVSLPVLFTRRFDKKSTVKPLKDSIRYLVDMYCFIKEIRVNN